MSVNLLNYAPKVCRDWCNEMPRNSLRKVVESGVYSFAFVILLSQNRDAALASAAIHAASAAIHALSVPLFRTFFQGSQIGSGKMALVMTCNMFAANSLFSYVTKRGYKADIFATVFLTIFFQYLFGEGRAFNLNEGVRYTPFGLNFFI